jgi:moderate conductance mechanosensitive channel
VNAPALLSPVSRPSPARGSAAIRLVAALLMALAVMLIAGPEQVAGAPDEPVEPTGTTVAPDPADPAESPVPADQPEEPEPGIDEVEEPVEPEPVEPEPVVGFPTETPPGFTDDQFRRFVNVVQACGFDGGRVCETVLSWTGNATLAESTQWVVDVPLRLIFILIGALLVNRVVRRLINDFAERKRTRALEQPDIDPNSYRRQTLRVTTAASTIGSAATALIGAVAFLIVLGELGITLGPLLAGAGIAGIALGFGAQNMVRDVLAGLFVVFEDQYGVGDIIDAGRCTGVVEEVTLRITKIRDVQGTLWFVPNGTIEGVGNLTQLWARAIIDFDIDYHADHEKAGRIIKETADRMWRDDDIDVKILEEPELWGVEDLGDSSVVVRIAVKVAPAQQWKVSRMLRGEVKKALDAEGISIPFPQQTVWIHSEPDAPTDSNGSDDEELASDGRR